MHAYTILGPGLHSPFTTLLHWSILRSISSCQEIRQDKWVPEPSGWEIVIVTKWPETPMPMTNMALGKCGAIHFRHTMRHTHMSSLACKVPLRFEREPCLNALPRDPGDFWVRESERTAQMWTPAQFLYLLVSALVHGPQTFLQTSRQRAGRGALRKHS